MGGIADVPEEDRRAARVVTGLLHYGVHRFVPQECEHITILREPVARVISMYQYALRTRRHRLHDELVGSGMGLEEFARTSADGGLDNLQTRMISGRKPGERSATAGAQRGAWLAPRLGKDDLEEAKRNLDRFLVVGLTERFDESFILIRRALGWRLPMYATRNVAEGQTRDPPSEAALELIRERNQLDLELYEHARGLFEAAVAREGPSFRREVATFKVLNQVPSKIAPRMPAALRRSLRSVLPR
jgi:hypothetical protein